LEPPVDRVDIEARLRAAKIIHERFKDLLEDIKKGKPPKLLIPKRTLSNTIFDKEKGILVLGDEQLEREFLDMGEARRFMQTLLMASIIYQALVENEYPTIRDLYYRGKHTIMYKDLRGRTRQENTWEEQSESDSALRDVEVMTGLLREDMLILSKEKGKVVGNMRIRSGGDIIDLSRLGHGAYAIESTPDLIEFIDWDADFVLVVEKDAVFQQLHRIGFWRKYKSILVTGAGQPDRATRRFVRRLNEELGLPVYVLTDSIPGDEVVVARDTVTGEIHVGPVEPLLAPFFTDGVDREWVQVPMEVPSWNPATGRIEWKPVLYAYRHRIEGHILELATRGRGTIRVTEAHSLFVFRDGRVRVLPARDIKPGDMLVVADRIPVPQGLSWQPVSGPCPVPATYSNTSGSQLQARLSGESTGGVSLLDERIGAVYVVENETRSKQAFNLLLMSGFTPTVTRKSGRFVLEIRGGQQRLSTGPAVKGMPDTRLVEVDGVRRVGYEGYVYDFAVEGNNSFIGGHGVVYHNSDPYGFYIYSVYKIGSIQLSYESERLATPKARFLGVMMTDIFGWRNKKAWLSERERRAFIIKAKDVDVKRAKELLRYPWFKGSRWKRELGLFLNKKVKLEIEALASKGLRFLAFKYIPEKIETGDWIE